MSILNTPKTTVQTNVVHFQSPILQTLYVHLRHSNPTVVTFHVVIILPEIIGISMNNMEI